MRDTIVQKFDDSLHRDLLIKFLSWALLTWHSFVQ